MTKKVPEKRCFVTGHTHPACKGSFTRWQKNRSKLVRFKKTKKNILNEKNSSLERFCHSVSLNVDLHYGDYRSKLMSFEEQRNIFYIYKNALA